MNKQKEYKTSNCINFLGFPTVFMYIEQILTMYPELKNNIFSIGSGGGYVEMLIDQLFNVDIKCVDPDPLSWIPEKTIYKNPIYSFANEIDDIYVKNCIVLLNWSSPDPDNQYDIESIIRLKPLCCLILTEVGFYRGAGSPSLHEFLNINNIQTFGQYDDNTIFNHKPKQHEKICKEVNNKNNELKYYTNSLTKCTYSKPGYNTSLEFICVCLSKNNKPFNLPTELLPYEHPNNCNDTTWNAIRKKWEKLMYFNSLPK